MARNLTKRLSAATARALRAGAFVAGALLALMLVAGLLIPPLERIEVLLLLGLGLAGLVILWLRRRRRARRCGCLRDWPAAERAEAPLVVLVHGTFAAHADWVQPNSQVHREISEAVGESADVVAFCWSGANTHLSRVRAGRALATQIDNAHRRRVFLVGHSHGGNVALLAAGATREPMMGVATLATPFLHFSSRHFPRARLGLVLLVVLALLWWTFVRPTTAVNAALVVPDFLGSWAGLAGLVVSAAVCLWRAGALVVWSARNPGVRTPWIGPREHWSALVRVGWTPWFTFGAVGLLLTISPAYPGMVVPRWTRWAAIGISVLLIIAVIRMLIAARSILGHVRNPGASGLSLFSRPRDLAATLNPGETRTAPVHVVTGLADEAAGLLFFAQFLGVVVRPLEHLIHRMLVGVIAGFGAALLARTVEVAISGPSDAAVLVARTFDLAPWQAVAFDVWAWASEGTPYLATPLFVLAGMALAASVTHLGSLLAAGTDVPLLALRVMPIVQQAPTGESTVVTADLSDAGEGLHHSRVYSRETGLGEWIRVAMSDRGRDDR